MPFSLEDLPPALRLNVRNQIIGELPQELASTIVQMLETDIDGIIRRHKRSAEALSTVHGNARAMLEQSSGRISSGRRDPHEMMDSARKAALEGLINGARECLISSLRGVDVSEEDAVKVADQIVATL